MVNLVPRPDVCVPLAGLQISSDEVENGRGAAGPSAAPDCEHDGRWRFRLHDRVVCRLAYDDDDDDEWAAGAVIMTGVEDDCADVGGCSRCIPYVVRVDAAAGRRSRLLSVRSDDADDILAEVCFGSRASALWYTLYCAPISQKWAPRFAVGERVAVAVEDATGDYSRWAAGVVEAADYSVEDDAHRLLPARDWEGHRVPYKVRLDGNGALVLVHRDEHWLVRDAALQPDGPRQAADGARCLARMVTRRRADGGWEAIDHATRRVERAEAPEDY